MRPVAPLLMVTVDLGQAKRRAISSTSSRLARPSMGGDCSRATHRPSWFGSSSVLTRALGLTFTRMILVLELPAFNGDSAVSRV